MRNVRMTGMKIITFLPKKCILKLRNSCMILSDHVVVFTTIVQIGTVRFIVSIDKLQIN